MNSIVDRAISEAKSNQLTFCKFVSANDAGETGGHQSGLYIPRHSYRILFDSPGEKGENKEDVALLIWENGEVADCKFSYYGKGSRNEYRATRLGRHFNEGDFVVLIKGKNHYLGFLLRNDNEIEYFLNAFALSVEDTNSLIVNETANFKPKAHILTLLGEELIKSPVMAIYELIKNGYDADAKNVDVIFGNIEDLKKAHIIIEDSGTGITKEVLKEVWFEPGTDFRKPVNEAGIRQIKRSPIFKRIPMGEKGVGRFAVHKLANKIKLISRPANIISGENGNIIVELLDYELEVEIDWRNFSQSKYLEDVNIFWRIKDNRSNFHFKTNSGTRIELSSLKEEWSRGMARQLKRQTISMLSPKNDASKFRINLDFKNWWLNDFPEVSAILETAPYTLIAFIDEDYNMTFDYFFQTQNNKSIGNRKIDKDSKSEIDRKKHAINVKSFFGKAFKEFLISKEYETQKIDDIVATIGTQKLPFGNLMLELYSFDLDSQSLKDTINTPSLVKELLKEHAGIKVFKGDLRVYDYGDPGNDWLGLDLKRVQNKDWFSNNQNIGYIYLDPETSNCLVEKTNREGFIENEFYLHFLVLVEFLLEQFKAERSSDRRRWLAFNKSGGHSSFEKNISTFKEIINNSDISENEKHSLLHEAEKIENQYQEDKNTLLIPASVGMSTSFAMHEIEKLIPRMRESVRSSPVDIISLRNQVNELEDYTGGILSIMRKGGIRSIDLLESLEQAISNYNTRLRSRQIEVSINIDPSISQIRCDKRLFIVIIMNLIDNSLYWLDSVTKPFKGIYFIAKPIVNGVSILVVDNGPGFKDSIEDIVSPFFTRKHNGIGIGMYLIDTVMLQFGKLNIIYDKNDLINRGIPDQYDGAAVELIFNKNQ